MNRFQTENRFRSYAPHISHPTAHKPPSPTVESIKRRELPLVAGHDLQPRDVDGAAFVWAVLGGIGWIGFAALLYVVLFR